MHTYFIVTIRVKDQTMMDSAPSRSSFFGALEKVEENTYRGLVPMSP
jgi:hypothetical protein